MEDFTTYIEVDPNNHIGLVGSNHIDFDSWNNEDAYLYKDFGVDQFRDFTYKIDVQRDSGTFYWYGAVCLFSNDVDDWYGLLVGNKTAVGLRVGNESGDISILLDELYNGSCYFGKCWISPGVMYYLLVKKVETSLKAGIYSTAAKRDAGNAEDGDVTNLALTLHADHKFRYVFPVDTNNNGRNNYMGITVENFDLQKLGVKRVLPNSRLLVSIRTLPSVRELPPVR
jgi:hypothetical protein